MEEYTQESEGTRGTFRFLLGDWDARSGAKLEEDV